MEVRPTCSVALLAGILLLASCQEKAPAGPVTVTFSLLADGSGSTRSDSGESEIRRWALLLFRDGKLAGYGLSSSREPITQTIQAGIYSACAVANYPESTFHPEEYLVAENLTEGTVDLLDNANEAPVMFGRIDLAVPSEDTPAIPVERLVCKAGIRKISVDFSDPSLTGQAFILQSIFLTNCCRTGLYGSDLRWEELPESKSSWYNPMGPDTPWNSLLGVRDLETVISPSEPYRIAHSFLYYPNPTDPEKDTHATSWSPRCTRMVIEARVGSRTCYYPVTLPPVPRNRTCIVEEIIIRRAGSSDPEQEIPEAAEIIFDASIQAWEQQYHDKDAF